MATYPNDCSALTDWTEQGLNAPADFAAASGVITSNTGSGEVLYHNAATADADNDDFEIVTKHKISAFSSTHYFLIGRGAGSNTGYVLAIRSTAIRTYYRGSLSGFGQITSYTASFSADTWYWFRFRVNGSMVKAKFWADGSPEPTTGGADGNGFQISQENTQVTGTGFIGLLANTNGTPTQSWGWAGIATNGDTAPTSAGGTNTDSAAASGSLTLTGSAATGLRALAGVAASGTVTLTGSAATGARGYAGTAGAGSIALTGSAATGVRTWVSQAASGSIVLTGSAASAVRALIGQATAGALTLTGADASGSVAGAGNTNSAAEPGAISLTPGTALGAWDRLGIAGAGSLSLTGADAVGAKGFASAAESGGLTLSGATAAGLWQRLSVAEAGTIILTGYAATGQKSGVSSLTAEDLAAIDALIVARLGDIAAAVAAQADVALMLARTYEMWGRLNLDPARDVDTTPTQIRFGDVTIDMAQAGDVVTTTRQ